MEESRERKVELFCPSLSKILEWLIWEEQRLDLGSIARGFGFGPWILKISGHFISRGLNLSSSSITWKSLLSFFSDKGLSTGKDECDALIVDGKLSKLGIKRAHDPLESLNEIRYVDKAPLRDSIGTDKRRPFSEDTNLLKSKKSNKSIQMLRERGDDISNSISRSTQCGCSYLRGSMKRIRDDEAIEAAPCKKIR